MSVRVSFSLFRVGFSYYGLVSRHYELAFRYDVSVSRSYELASRHCGLAYGFNELVSRYFELVSRKYELGFR